MLKQETLGCIEIRAACGWLDPETGKNDINRAYHDVDALFDHIKWLELELLKAKNPDWNPPPWTFIEEQGFELYDKNGAQVKQPKIGDKVFVQFIGGMALCAVTGDDKPCHLDTGGSICHLMEVDGVLLGSGHWINKKAIAKLTTAIQAGNDREKDNE